MLKKENKFRWSWLAGILSLIALFPIANAQNPYNYAVQTTVNVSDSPARITISWINNPASSGYTIRRKAANASSWTTVATLPGNASTWADSNVAVGAAYEYEITGNVGHSATGYVYAGINTAMIESRGKVLLVVDKTYAPQLASELTRLEQDLVGDGWTVVRRDVNRSDSAPTVKNVIKTEYNNGGLRSVLLFGHVAVPYSGDMYPDGHVDHRGAWAADVYYGDMDGSWTDSSVNYTSSAKAWNRNVPGDGKFDQSTLPSDVELEIGRVDLSNMTCFSNKTPSRSELDLLRQYLNKDHNFRHRLINVERRGAVRDNFGVPYGEAFAAAGWRLSSAFFGAGKATAIPGNEYFSNLSANSYLYAYGCGGGSFYTCAGTGGSDDFASYDTKAVFTLWLGSYFGDWDNESAFLRAPLGGSTYTLTSGFSGRPEWWLHHMALGETIGYGARLSQNNREGGTYSPQYQGTRGVHIALHGDPTLRLHPVVPPSSLVGVTVGSNVTLTWTPSSDTAIQGYHVYRSTSANGPFTRLTANMTTGLTYLDSAAPAGAIYMVRAVKLETSGSGAYYNMSQGLFYGVGTAGGGGGGPTAPVAPSGLNATALSVSQIRVTWSDNSANETGFKVERKTGVAGTYATLTTTAANVGTVTDVGLTQGTQYFYRLSALNAVGASATVEANASTAGGGQVTASAAFVSTDSASQGSWKDQYGQDGATVIGNNVTAPAYVQVTPAGNNSWTWTDATTDARALQKISGTDRVAAAWFVDGSFTVDLNFTDGKTHRVAMYFLDWDRSGRSQKVEILDAATGSILNTQTVSGFENGKYLVWDLKGAVRARFSKITGFNAVLNGLFFGPVTANSGGGAEPLVGSMALGIFNLTISGAPGQTFKVYGSADLGTWTEQATVTLTGSTFNYTDRSGRSGNKFYKTVLQ